MSGRTSRREVVDTMVAAGYDAVAEVVNRIVAQEDGFVTQSEVTSAFLQMCQQAVRVSRRFPNVSQAQIRLALQGMLFLTEPIGSVHDAEISPVPPVEVPIAGPLDYLVRRAPAFVVTITEDVAPAFLEASRESRPIPVAYPEWNGQAFVTSVSTPIDGFCRVTLQPTGEPNRGA